MTKIRTDEVEFVKELYPRLREDDSAIEQNVTGDGDPLVLARRAIDRHLSEVHGDDNTHAYADKEASR